MNVLLPASSSLFPPVSSADSVALPFPHLSKSPPTAPCRPPAPVRPPLRGPPSNMPLCYPGPGNERVASRWTRSPDTWNSDKNRTPEGPRRLGRPPRNVQDRPKHLTISADGAGGPAKGKRATPGRALSLSILRGHFRAFSLAYRRSEYLVRDGKPTWSRASMGPASKSIGGTCTRTARALESLESAGFWGRRRLGLARRLHCVICPRCAAGGVPFSVWGCRVRSTTFIGFRLASV